MKKDQPKGKKIPARSKDLSLYDRLFPITIKFEKEKIGAYIALIVIITALTAILLMIW